MDKKEEKLLNELFKAMLLLTTKKEMAKFMRDLMTKKELLEIANRWKAARMLREGVSYVEIQKKTGLSARTVARVSFWLKKGMGGYDLVMKRSDKKSTHKDSFPSGKS